MNVQKQEKGFTIIEVVLVLAIAALIFLMIFVALPALQRGQRDTARKNEAGTIASAVNTYRSNNRGTLPNPGAASGADLTKLKNDYIKNLNQIQLDNIKLVDNSDLDTANDPAEDGANIVTQAKCGGDSAEVSTSARTAAVVVFVENGGRYCQDV